MKIFKLILLILCIPAYFSNAQSNSFLSVKDDGHLYHIIESSTGGFVTIGTHSSGGVKNLQLAKWGVNFAEEWSFEFDGSEILVNVTNTFIKESRLGSYYLCAPAGYDSVAVFKISATGNLLWQKNYGVSGAIIALAFQIGPEGDDGFLFGTGSCSVSNGITKCDGNGNIEWSKRYNRTDANGVVWCSGIINQGSGYILTSNLNGNSFVLQKIDGSGNLLSYKGYENTSKSMISQRTIKFGDKIAVLGNYNNSNGNIDKFLCYLDTNLNFILYNDLETTDGSEFYIGDMCVDPSGQNILLNGITHLPSFSTSFILSLSASGNFNWKYKTTERRDFYDIITWSGKIVSVGVGVSNGFGYPSLPVVNITDNSGGGMCDSLVFPVANSNPVLNQLAGLSLESSVNINGVPSAHSYSNNIVFDREIICGSASLGFEEENEIDQLTIYPNPVDAYLTLAFPSENQVNLTIRDLSGKQIMHQSNVSEGQQIDVSGLSSGMYTVELYSKGELITRKIVKE